MSTNCSPPYQFEYADQQLALHPFPNSVTYPAQDEHPASGPAFFSYSPDVVKHRKRTSRAQRKVLEEAFRQNPKPSQYTRKLLIHQTGMDRRSLQVWFQNRRAKEKKVTAKTNSNSIGSQHSASETQALNGIEESKELSPDSPEQSRASPPQKDSTNAPDSDSSCIPSDKANSVSPEASERPIPNARRSYDSTPGGSIRALVPPDITSTARRGSAPAPLGIQVAPPPTTYTPDNHHPGDFEFTPAYPATNPLPGPSEDGHGFRRGSLPSSYLNGHDARITPQHLPPIPSDPNIRKSSLERSRMRLSSHPYAWQVTSTHPSLPIFGMPGHPAMHSPHMPPSASIARNAPRSINPSTGVERNLHPDCYLPVPVVSNSYLPPWNVPEPGHSRLRYSLPQLPAANLPLSSEILPGPLPQPGYSFGTAPASIPEDDSNIKYHEEREDRAPQYRESHYLPRFGSLASAISTDSSVSSALYSEGRTGVLPEDDYQVSGWQPDTRRASCPAPFMSSFAGLAVNPSRDRANHSQTVRDLNLPPTAEPSLDPDRLSSGVRAGQDEGYNFPPPSSKQPSNGRLPTPAVAEYDPPAFYRKSPQEKESNQTPARDFTQY